MTARAATPAPALDGVTTLAFERTRVAYERTMMAWVRTATSLITFGFSVYKFFQFDLQGTQVATGVIGPRGFGLALIAIGLLSLVLGAFEHARDMRSLREHYASMPSSKSAWVAVVIAALGLLAFVAVVLRA